jgi:hypothetical protein
MVGRMCWSGDVHLLVARKQRVNAYASWFSPLIPSGLPAYGWCHTHSELVSPLVVNPLWKHPHRHTQQCASLIS